MILEIDLSKPFMHVRKHSESLQYFKRPHLQTHKKNLKKRTNTFLSEYLQDAF